MLALMLAIISIPAYSFIKSANAYAQTYPANIKLGVGETISAKMTYMIFTSFSSNQPDVVSVSSEGKITALKTGHAVVRAVRVNGDIYEYLIEVKPGYSESYSFTAVTKDAAPPVALRAAWGGALDLGWFAPDTANLSYPNKAVTREQFLLMLYQTAQPSVKKPTMPFSDVPVDTPLANAIIALVDAGIVKKEDFGAKLLPKSKISRGDAAVLLARWLTLKPDASKLDKTESKSLAGKAGLIGAAMNAGLFANIVKSGAKLQPGAALTRAETAALLLQGWDKQMAKMTVKQKGTRLVQAALNGQWGEVRLWIKKDTDVNYSARNMTTIEQAFSELNYPMVQWLLDRGANPNSEYHHVSLLMRTTSAGLTSKLIAKGANPDFTTPNLGTALEQAILRGNTPVVTALLEGGADPNFAIEYAGKPPLITAINSRNYEIAKLLLEHGSNPNFQWNFWGTLHTPLSDAAMQSTGEDGTTDADVQLMKLLLEHDADVELGHPLFQAVNGNHLEATKLLLDAGADPNKPDPNGNNLVYLAKVLHENDAIANLLQQYGGRTN